MSVESETSPDTPAPPAIEHRTRVLVLQHPQEMRQEIATAPLLVSSLAHARRRVGLSWASLRAAWGDEQGAAVDSAKWAVLYLGARAETPAPDAPIVQMLDRKGTPVADQAAARRAIEGIVLLDGTWAQAKTLWWRNAWLLKLRRIVLNPRMPSLYGPLRREPRPGALSTIEAAALALAEFERAPRLQEELLERFRGFLADHVPPPQPKGPAGRRGGGRHRRGRRPASRPPA